MSVSALNLIVQLNLASVQAAIQVEEHNQILSHEQYRMQHLSQQIFNMTPVASQTQSQVSNRIVVALLSYQLATHTIANIINCNNAVLKG